MWQMKNAQKLNYKLECLNGMFFLSELSLYRLEWMIIDREMDDDDDDDDIMD